MHPALPYKTQIPSLLRLRLPLVWTMRTTGKAWLCFILVIPLFKFVSSRHFYFLYISPKLPQKSSTPKATLHFTSLTSAIISVYAALTVTIFLIIGEVNDPIVLYTSEIHTRYLIFKRELANTLALC
ncbi:hypothetical protein BJV82DRAFT_612986 [Fennellomyces sp. T-0311]|nr:hypothetical protein BJV82DRAFT_612986 [Fennellomyces sp. T-0311]